MRDVNAAFTAEKNKRVNKPIHLYIIEDYNGAGGILRFAEHASNVTFAGQTYTKFPIKFNSVNENNRGQIDSVQIVLANVSRLIQSYLEDFDFRGKKVTIRTVWEDEIAVADAYMDDVYYIDSYEADQDNVVFTLASKLDVLDVQLPRRAYSRNFCGWRFKGAECAYAGAESTCNKTKQRCKELNNFQRFGGFPSIPSNRQFVG